MTISNNKPDIIQAFDVYIDRQYYKIVPGFFGSSKELIRTDTIKNWIEWQISCKHMPDKIVVNGETYKLVKLE